MRLRAQRSTFAPGLSGRLLQLFDLVEQNLAAIDVDLHEGPVVVLVLRQTEGAENPTSLGISQRTSRVSSL